MKHPRVATLSLALAALASAGALAADGDRWYGSNAPSYDLAVPASSVPLTASQPETVYTVEPVTVAREFVAPEPPRDVVVYQPYVYSYDPRYAYGRDMRLYDPHHPSEGQLVGRGLFNRRGPNDFGQ